MEFIFHLARRYGWVYLAALILIIVTNLLEVGWVRLAGRAVEQVAEGSAGWTVPFSLALLAIVIFCFRWSNRNISFWAGRTLERRLRSHLFARTLALEEEEMDNQRTGDLVSRIINDVSDVRMVLGSGFLQVTNSSLAYLTTIGAMVYIFPRMAIIVVIPVIPMLILAYYLNGLIHRRSVRSLELLGRLSSVVEEGFSGIEVTRTYSAEGWQRDRFRKLNRSHYDAEISRVIPETFQLSFMSIAVWLGITMILLSAGYFMSDLAQGSDDQIADLATFIFLFARLVWPTLALGWIMNVIQRGHAAARRLSPFLDETSGEDADAGTSPRLPDTTIRITNMSFAYPSSNRNVLDGLDIEIKEGEWVGVVGPTGSGKTTLASSLAGLRRPTEGSVTIGGREVYAWSDEFRSKIVHLATQVPTLFSMSIRDNLLVGNAVKGSDGNLTEALKIAAFDTDLVQLSRGIETEVGERGYILSGGQRQRLSLARALLQDTPILVLDDILSAVDIHTEKRIIEGLERARRGKTTIFVTHRFMVLSKVDRVLLLKDGRIAADGPLEEVTSRSRWLQLALEEEKLKRGGEAI